MSDQSSWLGTGVHGLWLHSGSMHTILATTTEDGEIFGNNDTWWLSYIMKIECMVTWSKCPGSKRTGYIRLNICIDHSSRTTNHVPQFPSIHCKEPLHTSILYFAYLLQPNWDYSMSRGFFSWDWYSMYNVYLFYSPPGTVGEFSGGSGKNNFWGRNSLTFV